MLVVGSLASVPVRILHRRVVGDESQDVDSER